MAKIILIAHVSPITEELLKEVLQTIQSHFESEHEFHLKETYYNSCVEDIGKIHPDVVMILARSDQKAPFEALLRDVRAHNEYEHIPHWAIVYEDDDQEPEEACVTQTIMTDTNRIPYQKMN